MFEIFVFEREVKKEIPWYQYYTFKTEAQFEDWKNFCVDTFRKEFKMTKKQAEHEFEWFNYKFGLKIDYNETKI